jgi:hypothetical protein
MVLGTAMTITVVGMAAVSVRRVRVRSASETNSFAAARLLAFSGAEHATVRINADSDWRNTFNGATIQQTIDGGTFSWRVVDPVDGDLTDDTSEAATIIATGTHDDTSYTLKLGVTISGGGTPIEALTYAVMANNDVEIKDKKTVSITGAPLGSNCDLKLKKEAVLNGDVVAKGTDLDDDAVINGTVTEEELEAGMPSSAAFNTYKAKATTLNLDTSKDVKIEEFLLSPSNNPWGATNADGVYYIDTQGHDLTINLARIHGTLVIDTNGGKVKVGKGKDAAVLIENYRSDYPTLIVKGKLDIEFDSEDDDLTESDAKTNLNPSGSPYEGQADSDSSDSYPNEIRGLVHSTGETKLKKHVVLRGALICEDKVKFDGDAEIIYDSSYSANPPAGYSAGSSGPTTVEPGQWERQVN